MVKNYTSEVKAEKSVMHIEFTLIKHGANKILKTVEAHRLTGISFIMTVNGTDMPFRLPARIDRVEKQLKSLVKKPQKGTLARITEQAERTSWKLLADWVDIQMSLVELDQVEIIEVFMPYIWDGAKNKTLFEQMKSNGFAMLEDRHSGK